MPPRIHPRCPILAALALTIFVPALSRAEDPQEPPRGYSIPLIDLADQERRQVVVDREQGQYLGHPTTVLLEDGRTMIAVYPEGHGRGPIVMKRSEDGGRSWSDRLPTPENWATSKETPTIHRVVDPRGKKRLILFSGLYPIRMASSEDDGRSWTPLEPIGDFGGIVAMSSVERLEDGSYMALFHDDGRFFKDEGTATTFRVYKTLSTDGGLSWGEPEVIAEHPTAHLCEPGLIRSPDGKQIAVLLRENSRTFNSFLITSDDEGRTWSEPRQLPGALTGDRHVGTYAPDGRLFLSFRDTTHESPTRGDWVGWVGTYDDLVEGREGQYRVRLMDNTKGADCAYPGVEALPDGTLVVTTYGHWAEGEAPYIVSVRFTLEEIDELAGAGGAAGPGSTDFTPTDRYETREIGGWTVLVHSGFLDDHPALAGRTLDRLRHQLDQIDARLPRPAVETLRRVRIWVEEAEPNHPCMAYHPSPRWLLEHGMNPEKAGCVEVANARNFLSWTRDQPWMVLHELAHAYHHQFLDGGFGNPEVRDAFEQATESKSYERVLRIDGRDDRAYALNDPMEYFAEATEAFFGTNDFYPYVRSELQRHDPGLSTLLESLWGGR
ncbi:exo-alpha-sialidase [Tautonia plasticadhaerens]|uniref:BNR/Asp-box repeat protein n=1 Tax=Tautonia plasticadhaerens TaxID=2527974 RepID=A0A518HB36_9BACT|nr:exo-alpha-sialidase [Tautonia plasticadhaerens]QDV38070.1 hypothetical protein ElP_60180 [Tautonia plasticadhaerens]